MINSLSLLMRTLVSYSMRKYMQRIKFLQNMTILVEISEIL